MVHQKFRAVDTLVCFQPTNDNNVRRYRVVVAERRCKLRVFAGCPVESYKVGILLETSNSGAVPSRDLLNGPLARAANASGVGMSDR